MISPEIRAQIRRYFYAEHWKIGTIASELKLHPDTVRQAVESHRFQRTSSLQPSKLDPYMVFVRQTLEQHPRLRATRIYQMIQQRGYTGSVVQLRRAVACLRPRHVEPFLSLRTFPGEQAQVDWASFGKVRVGRAQRHLSCFVMTLSYSRALYLEFFFDQTMESFLRGHVRAFQFFSGQPRIILYDNLKSAVIERRGNHIAYHPHLIELCAHYHFEPKACQVRAANQKGRVERAIRYIRDSFWAGRSFTTLAECNRQAAQWRDQVAHPRPWPQDTTRSVESAFAEEQPRLIPLPLHPFPTDLIVAVQSRKSIYVCFDLNQYSIPPEAAGKPLTLIASDTVVRIAEGDREIARHVRSYDRQQQVLDPEHQKALLESKRKGIGVTATGRLALVAPESETLLDRAFVQGESASQQTAQLVKLLNLYGASALRRAIQEALQHDTPRASAVAYLLGKQLPTTPQAPVDLSRHPELEAIEVRPHNLEVYDALAYHNDPSES